MRRAIVILGCCLVSAATGASGLDPQFGSGGTAVLDSGGSSSQAAAAILQSDGKIVVVGTTPGVNDPHFYPELIDPIHDFLIARFNSTGTPDSTFGKNGVVQIDFSGTDDRARGVAQQPDGKLLVVGETSSATGHYDFAIVRLLEDGTFDKTFNGSGMQVVNFPITSDTLGITQTVADADDQANAVLQQQDGKLVVLGLSALRPRTSIDFSARHLAGVRLLANGTIDTTFGDDGTGLFSQKFATDFDGATITANGEIQYVGTNAFIRMDANGRNRNYYGTSDSYGWYAAIWLPNGNILAGGDLIDYYQSPAVATQSTIVSLNSQFTVDTGFGANGVVSGALGPLNQAVMSLVPEPDGSIIATGYASRTSTPGGANDAVIGRLSKNGAADVNFGTSGLLTVSFDQGATVHSFRPVAALRNTSGQLILVGNRGDVSTASTLTELSLSGLMTASSQNIALARVNLSPTFALPQAAQSATSGTVKVQVTRTGKSMVQVSVNYATVDGTAKAGMDFTSTAGTLTWQPGDEDAKTVEIPILQLQSSVDRTFKLEISDPSQGSVTVSSDQITIHAQMNSGASPGEGGGGGGALSALELAALGLLSLRGLRAKS